MGPSVIPTTGARESSVSSSSRQGKPGNMKIGDLAMAIFLHYRNGALLRTGKPAACGAAQRW